MSTFFESMAALVVGAILCHLAARMSLEATADIILSARAAEHELHVCGALSSLERNLDDIVRLSKDRPGIEAIKHGFVGVQTEIRSLQDRLTRLRNPCELGGFVAETYRLNGKDDPRRRVNWAYRFAKLEAP